MTVAVRVHPPAHIAVSVVLDQLAQHLDAAVLLDRGGQTDQLQHGAHRVLPHGHVQARLDKGGVVDDHKVAEAGDNVLLLALVGHVGRDRGDEEAGAGDGGQLTVHEVAILGHVRPHVVLHHVLTAPHQAEGQEAGRTALSQWTHDRLPQNVPHTFGRIGLWEARPGVQGLGHLEPGNRIA